MSFKKSSANEDFSLLKGSASARRMHSFRSRFRGTARYPVFEPRRLADAPSAGS
jgi:hypothetical protein